MATVFAPFACMTLHVIEPSHIFLTTDEFIGLAGVSFTSTIDEVPEDLMIGQNYTLNCNVQFLGITGQIAFVWRSPDGNSVPTTTDTRRIDTQGLNSQLQFLPIQEFHAGNYTCQVISDNSVGLTNRAEVVASSKKKKQVMTLLFITVSPLYSTCCDCEYKF